MKEFLPYLAVLISLIAAAISLVVAIRAGRWRDSDAAKAIVDRIIAVEGTGQLHGQRIDQLEADIQCLPSKADFARLEGEVKSTWKISDRVEKAVLRLEDYWLKGTRS